jgi:hypothetical protein
VMERENGKNDDAKKILKFAKAILLKLKEHELVCDAIEKHGVELHSVRVDIIDDVLGLLGVPKEDVGIFCHDWLIDRWIEIDEYPEDKVFQAVKNYPRWVLKQMELYRKEESRNGKNN